MFNFIKKQKNINYSLEDTLRNEKIFYLNYIKPGMSIFDVGANIGELSILFANQTGKTGKVYSFEPSSSTFKKLSKGISIYANENVVLNNLAVSDSNEEKLFNIYNEDFSSWNTFVNRPLENYGLDVKPIAQQTIKCITIDDYCKQHNIQQIDLLKIDTEGFEINVLRGAKNMFIQKKITCCAFEFGQTIFDAGTTVNEFIEFFKTYDYTLSNANPNQRIFPVDNAGVAIFSLMIAHLNH